MIVECHPNFNRDADLDCVSMRPVERGMRTKHYGTVLLTDATFKIHEGGRQKSVRTGVKNVHAWVRGNLLSAEYEQIELTDRMRKNLVPVFYHFNVGRFLTNVSDRDKVVDITEGQFSVAYCVGRRLYVHNRSW